MPKQHGFLRSVVKCYTYLTFIPTKLTPTIHDLIINLKKGTWCQSVWHQLVVLWDPIPTTDADMNPLCGPLCAAGLDGVGPVMSAWLYGRRVYLRCRPVVLSRKSFNMWDSWNLPMFLLRDGSYTLIIMASLMVLVVVCDSLLTMEKLSNLVWLHEVLAWSKMGRVL